MKEDAWAKHSDALAADAALQQDIVHVLLDHCLPATAEALQAEAAADGLYEQGAGWLMLLPLATVLQQKSVRPAVIRRSVAPGVAAAVGHAAAILSLLPASRAGSMPGDIFSLLLMQGTSLLGSLLGSLDDSNTAARESSSAAASLASQAELAAAGWHVVQLMPRLAASFAAELDDPQAHAAFPYGLSNWLTTLSVACVHLAHLLGLVYELPLSDSDPAQLAAWLAAVTASLRLPQRLSALDVQLKQHNIDPIGAQMCCASVMRQLVGQLPGQLEEAGWQVQQQRQQLLQHQQQSAEDARPGSQAAAWGSLVAPLWAFHTSLCRLVAALSSTAAPLNLPGVALHARAWQQLLFCLNASLSIAADSCQLANERLQPSLRACWADFPAGAFK